MRKVSIIYNGLLEPIGGPSGYLYNLKYSLELNKIKEISIVTPKRENSNSYSGKNSFSKIKKTIKESLPIPKFILHYYRHYRNERIYKKLYLENKDIIEKSEILHFHTTLDLYFFSRVYNIKRHKVILMSHSPVPRYIESFESNLNSGYHYNVAKYMAEIDKEIDVYAFKHSDYIVFPCEDAIEPYLDFLKENSIDITGKAKYILTGVLPLVPKINSVEFKIKYSIPLNKKIICFIGRKTYIKGFDIFCNIAKKFLDKSDFFFVSAGKGEIKPPILENFKDIGWTNDPDSLINCCDVIVIPNRMSYCDINLIQSMSLGKPIITTKTGGHKWFVDKDANIFYGDINDLDSFVRILQDESIYMPNDKNIRIYKKYFSIENFALNYLRLYNEI